MAINVIAINPAHFGWMISASTADASGAEQLVAAPAAGLCIVVHHLTIYSAGAISIQIGEGEGVPGSLDSTFIDLAWGAGETKQWDFGLGGMLCTAATLLGIDSSGAGAIALFGWGIIV